LEIYRHCAPDATLEKVILINYEVKAMKNDDERSYERYKQYRRNKYRYEQEQIIFPIAVIVGLAVLISLWKYILIALAVIAALALVVVVLYLYLKKQLKSEQDIILSQEDAKEGVEAKINVYYNSQKVSFLFDIPSNVKDGQKFVAKDILFKNKKGKNIKKNVHFKVRVQ
jgi:vacuolar-type H+-ATPase subunit F/Vma7